MLNRIKIFWKQSHLIRVVVISYVCIVLLFAIINWCMFLYNTTSFLISEQMNKHVNRIFVFWDIDSIMNAYHLDIKDQMPVSIEGFSALIKPNVNKLDSLITTRELIKKEIESCDSTLSHLYMIADDERQNAVDNFKDSMLLKIQQRIDSLKCYIKERDDNEMVLSGKYVELARLEERLAKKNVEVCSYVFEHWGSFVPDSISKKLTELNERKDRLASENYEIEIQRGIIARNIAEFINLFHQNRKETVGFEDFLYYSICVSTTASFGDIAPNSSWTRRIAILELLLCMVLVGFIVDRFNNYIGGYNRD